MHKRPQDNGSSWLILTAAMYEILSMAIFSSSVVSIIGIVTSNINFQLYSHLLYQKVQPLILSLRSLLYSLFPSKQGIRSQMFFYCDRPTHDSPIKCIVNIFKYIKFKKRGLTQRDMDSRAKEENCLFGMLKFSCAEKMKLVGQPLKASWCLIL